MSGAKKVIALLVLTNLALLFQAQVFSMGNFENLAVQPKKIEIKDREFLKYSIERAGEKTQSAYFVSRVEPDNHDVTVFIEMVKAGEDKKFSAAYSNYSTKIVYSSENNSLKDYVFNGSNMSVSEISTAPDDMHLAVDFKNNESTFLMNTHAGKEKKTALYKQKLLKGVPVWNVDSLMFIGARTINIDKGGIFYILEPLFFKDPIPGHFKKLGEETITTPAGTFKTIKVGFEISDPFLGKLLLSVTSKLFFWIEDGPRSLIVKDQFNEDSNILEEISSWK